MLNDVNLLNVQKSNLKDTIILNTQGHQGNPDLILFSIVLPTLQLVCLKRYAYARACVMPRSYDANFEVNITQDHIFTTTYTKYERGLLAIYSLGADGPFTL